MRFLLSYTALLVLVGACFGQADKFDIVTFTAPKGWTKEVSSSAVQFGKVDAKGSIAFIMLLKQIPAGADPKENFSLAWKEIVGNLVTPGTPQFAPEETVNGWTVTSGSAPYEADGRKGAVMLVSASGGAKMVNAVILANSDAFQAEIAAFVGSIKLPPIAAGPVVKTPTANNGSIPAGLLEYEWSASQNRKQPGTGDNAGYSKRVYRFAANGAYTFYAEAFQFYTPKYYLEKESGTYQVEGNRIFIKPLRSVATQHRLNKEDPPMKTESLKLEQVEYAFELTEINNSPSLILAPGAATRRDGTFNFWLNGQQTTSYLYGARLNGNVVYR